MSIPFNNFNEYFQALSLAMSSPDYNSTYPNYEKFLDENHDGDLIIIKHLLTTENAQQGLDGFIETCLKGHRYACEFLLDEMIVPFLEMGAKPNIDRLFLPIYDNLDDEIPEYKVRGKLIDAITGTQYHYSYITDTVLVPFVCANYIDVWQYGDWKSVDAAEWQGDYRDDFECTRLSELKYHSAYLQHV